MQGFFDYLKDFKSLSGWLMKGVLVVPLIALLAELPPSWPSRPAATGLSILTEALLLMYAYELWGRIGVGRLRKRVRLGVALSAVLLILYLVLWSVFTKETVNGERIEKGWEHTAAARRMMDELGIPEDQLLEDAGFDPTKVWTPASVTTVRVAMTIVWLAFVAVFGLLAACFTLLLRRRSPSTTTASP